MTILASFRDGYNAPTALNHPPASRLQDWFRDARRSVPLVLNIGSYSVNVFRNALDNFILNSYAACGLNQPVSRFRFLGGSNAD